MLSKVKHAILLFFAGILWLAIMPAYYVFSWIKLHIKKFLIAIGIFGVVLVVFSLENNLPPNDLGVVPPCVAVNNEEKCMVWTDVNSNETLIIRSDWGVKHNIMGITRIHFSVTNNSNTQEVFFVFHAPPRWELRDVLRNDGTTQVEVPAIYTPATATTSEQVKVATSTRTDTIWTDLQNTKGTTLSVSQKSVQGAYIGKSGVADNIKAGETKFYSASFFVNGDGEFFVEAFGSRGAYGHLDPTAFTADDNFNSYSDGNLAGNNGGNGDWSGAWSLASGTDFSVQGTTVYEGAKAIKSNSASGDERRAITTALSEAVIYWAWRSSDIANQNASQFMLTSSGSVKAQISIGDVNADSNSGVEQFNGTAWTNIVTGLSDDTWYPTRVTWDDATQNDKFKVEVYSGGSWSSGSHIAGSGTFTDLDGIRLVVNTTPVIHYDTICGTDIAAGGCEDAVVVAPPVKVPDLPRGFFQ